ncbi:MAG: hypothetical protein ACK44W_03935, partial [Planctomycetota bacterium]
MRRTMGATGLFFLAGVSLGAAQESGKTQAPPSRKEFDALKKELESLRQQGSPQGGRSGDARPLSFTIGGQYRIVADASNFGWHPPTVTEDQDTSGFVNQRFRTWFSVAPSEGVLGYLQMELGHITWGENLEWTKTVRGPRLPASADPQGDRVGVELRRAYLQYRHATLGLFRAGIQDWHDAFGEHPSLGSPEAVDDYDSFGSILANSIWDFNVAGVSWTLPLPDPTGLTLNAGAFSLWEGDPSRADDVALFALDADLTVTESGCVGASVYYLKDRGTYSYPTVGPYKSSWDLWLGVRGALETGPGVLRMFAIWNVGRRDDSSAPSDFEHHGWAAKLELGECALGSGRFWIQGLYATGEGDPTDRHSNEFRTIAQSERDNFGAQGYWSYLALTSPHGPSDVNDLGLSVQNRGLGLWTVQAKYEYRWFEYLSTIAAVGWLRAAQNNPANGEKDMGTEIMSAWALDL